MALACPSAVEPGVAFIVGLGCEEKLRLTAGPAHLQSRMRSADEDGRRDGKLHTAFPAVLDGLPSSKAMVADCETIGTRQQTSGMDTSRDPGQTANAQQRVGPVKPLLCLTSRGMKDQFETNDENRHLIMS